MKAIAIRGRIIGVFAIVVSVIVFILPFAFIFLTASKDENESSDLTFSLPTQWHIIDNIKETFAARDGILVVAFKNSTILTVVSVAILVVLCSMVGFVLQRRPGKVAGTANVLVLAGLIIPPAVVPTIWVLQHLHLFKTLPGLILVEVAFTMAFAVLLFRAFVAAIPRELDEAAILDGCSGFSLFFRVIFPLLRPVTVTVVVVQSVFVFNNFDMALYYLPGDENATVQLTLYNYQAQSVSAWNLLFMAVLVITIPLLIMYIIFNRQIVAGMTAGAVKG